MAPATTMIELSRWNHDRTAGWLAEKRPREATAAAGLRGDLSYGGVAFPPAYTSSGAIGPERKARSVSPCYSEPRDPSHEHMMADTPEQGLSIVGTWTKTTTAACADKYPARLTFSTGTYRGTRGPGQGMVWWDAGIYRLKDDNTLVVGTATDELVTYMIVLQADRFEVTDAEGCVVTYQRAQ
jgi:hypothetical protein